MEAYTAQGLARTSSGNDHAFLWDSGMMTDLGTLGGLSSNASAVNDYGQVVGGAETASFQTHAVLWDREGHISDLGTPGGAISAARDINNKDRL